MKKQWKTKCEEVLKKCLTYFGVYGILPLVCGMAVGLIFLVGRMGSDGARSLFSKIGEKSIVAAVGADAVREETAVGFYFLSGEIPLPVFTENRLVVGIAQYFRHATKDTPSNLPSPEKRYDALPVGATPIVRADLSSSSPYINTTKYTIDLEEARETPFPCGGDTESGEPLVLVLHTHGTECYFEDNTNLSDFAKGEVESYFIEGETLFRTSDPKKSVVQVGKVFTDTLIARGIPTLHCTVMHDANDFNDAYQNSAETVKRYLKEYPSIQYVIDLHRDSVVRGESWVKTFTQVKGENSAQVMLVVGTNQNGRHPNWKKNLAVATAYKDTMDRLYPSLSRSLYLRTARFNQEHLPGCMLLEVGSAANTLEEAQTAAEFAAEALARLIRDKQ